MSLYENALKRLLREQPSEHPTAQEVEDLERGSWEAESVESEPRQRRSRCSDRLPSESAYGALLDLLLARVKNGGTAGMVLCGASDLEKVDKISLGLEREARDRHLRTQAARLLGTGPGPLLHPLSSSPESLSLVPLLSELGNVSRRDRSHVLRALGRWAEQALSSHDFVLVEAPPLSVSVDGAIVARSFDGVVIVVEPHVTTKDALTLAVSQVQAAGCRLLGLVMSGKQILLPRLVRRALSRS